MPLLRRVSLALLGSTLGALLVAVLEANATSSASSPFAALARIDLGLIAPLTVFVGVAVGLASYLLSPAAALAPWEPSPQVAEHEAALGPADLARSRARRAAAGILVVVCLALWTAVMGPLAAVVLSDGAPVETGIRLALLGGFALGAAVALGLALVQPVTMGILAMTSPSAPARPGVATSVALVVAAALFGWGIAAGDPSGSKGGLQLFAVLGRHELDLRPAADLLVVALFAYAATWALVKVRFVALAGVAGAAAILALTAFEAKDLDQHTDLALALEQSAPLGRTMLAALRHGTDRDHDGAARLFGGGDCNDRDPSVNPNALDVPGNGIDEDCSGEDERAGSIAGQTATTSADTSGKTGADAGAAAALPTVTFHGETYNLLLITVDTLRTDVGFLGYAKPTSPNLDKLAAKGVVFDDAYSMASYTGKALGPLMIGKYPSETLRDGGHFNVYGKDNTFIAERAKAGGLETLGAASHWYFSTWTGLLQGIDVWDLSAKPPSGQGDTDGNITGDKVSDAALKMLARPELQSQRFFMWLHYFDPHAQYMAHPGAPDFAAGETTNAGRARAAYDGEVWFTDQQIGRVLDVVAASSFGAKTMVVVTADHGEAFADHGMSMHGVEIWESLIRVPIVVVAPGLPPHHVPVKRSHVDLVPTMIDLLSLPKAAPGELSGVSLLPDLVSATGPFVERDVYIDMPIGPYTGMRRALIHGDTPGVKLISFGNAYQMFDLAKDPEEKQDLVSSDKPLFQDMLQRMKTLRSGLHEIDVKPTEK